MAERPTAHSIALCSLIVLYQEERINIKDVVDTNKIIGDSEEGGERTIKSNTIKQDGMINQRFEEFLWKYVDNYECQSLKSGSNTVSISLLLKSLKDAIISDDEIESSNDDNPNLVAAATTFLKTFECWLRVAAKSFDAMMDLMQTLQAACAQSSVSNNLSGNSTSSTGGGTLDETSLQGMFVRAVCLGWEQLSFAESINLWKDFQQQVHNINKDMPSLTFNYNNSGAAVEEAIASHFSLSDKQKHRLWIQKCRHFEEQVTENEKKEASIPQEELDTIPSALLYQFLQASRSGDRSLARQSWQAYLDASHDVGPFADLVLANWHQSQGERVLAQLATHEAMGVAQQSHQPGSVALALAYQGMNSDNGSNNSNNHEKGNNSDNLMSQATLQAIDAQWQSLATGTQLQHAMNTNDWSAWQASVRETSAIDATGHIFDRPTQLQPIVKSRKEALQLLARQASVAPSLADSAIHAGELANKALIVHGKYILPRHVLTQLQTLARSCLYATHIPLLRADKDMDTCLMDFLEDSKSFLNQQSTCIYANALSHLQSIGANNPNDPDDTLKRDSMLIQHEWAVRRHHFHYARTLQIQLESSWHPRWANSQDIIWDLKMQKSLYFAGLKRWNEAKAIAEELLKDEQLSPSQQMRVLWHLSWLRLASAPHEYTQALPTLFQCLQLCEKHEWRSRHAAALSLLGLVHVRMRQPQQAIEIVRQALPLLLEQEHVWVQAFAFLTLAKAHLMVIKNDNVDAKLLSAKQIQTHRQRALRELERSKDLFHKCQDCTHLQEVFYLQARLHNELGDIQKRDESSKLFVKLSSLIKATSQMDKFDLANPMKTSQHFDNVFAQPVQV